MTDSSDADCEMLKRLRDAPELFAAIAERREESELAKQQRLRAQWPPLDFDRLGERWWPAAGESEAQLAARCGVFASRLHRATDWGETVYVSHWGFIRGLTGLAVGNGTVVELRPGPDASVVHAPEP